MSPPDRRQSRSDRLTPAQGRLWLKGRQLAWNLAQHWRTTWVESLGLPPLVGPTPRLWEDAWEGEDPAAQEKPTGG